MLRFRQLMLLLSAALLCSTGYAQTVDELIAKNVEARGGMDKLKSVQTLRLTGRMTMGPGLEAPIVLTLKRPSSMRMDLTFQGMTAVQAYDGKNGWQIMPFQGRTEPEPLSPEDLKEAAQEADIDGPLVDYAAKGHKVELIGKEPVEGSDAWKLKVTLKDGDIRYVYLDADYFLQVKSEGKRMVRGSELETDTLFGDFKEVDGLVFPHSIDSGAKGHPERQKIAVEKIEINVPVDDASFQMPQAPKAAPTTQN